LSAGFSPPTRGKGEGEALGRALNELGDGAPHAAWTLATSKSGLLEDQSLRAKKAIKGKTDGPVAVR
jgi:hypothetical protein